MRCAVMIALVALAAGCDRAPGPAAGESVQAPAGPAAATRQASPTGETRPGDEGRGPDEGFRAFADDVVAATDSLASLRARHGAANVVATKVPGAEGEEFDGWVLFPEDATRRLHVYLDDAGKPSMARVLDRESTWQRRDGIRMGLTLAELV